MTFSAAVTTVVFISLSAIDPSSQTIQRNLAEEDGSHENHLFHQINSSNGIYDSRTTQSPDSLDHVECGKPIVQPSVYSRIVGGSEARPHSWPWQVSLRNQKMDGGKHICGASIINPYWILTAAHCIRGVSEYTVIVGLHSLSSNALEPLAKIYNVSEAVIYDGYISENFQNDLALLQLAEPIQFNAHVRPICIPRNDQQVPLDMCVVTGWGDTRKTGDEMVLNQMQTPLLNRSHCRFALRVLGQPVNNDKIICAGVLDGSQDACQGDSGGPLVCLSSRESRWIQHGIISVGIGCANKRNPGLYTRVSSFVKWIESKTKLKRSSKTN